MSGGNNLKIYPNTVLVQLLLVAALIVSIISNSYGDKSEVANDCEARCATLDGENRYRCQKTCINTKKKNAPVGENEVKRKMDTCEDACVDYTGVDKIRCIRLCLDRKKERVVIKRESPKKENEKPCEIRCSVLSGVSKDKCMARCEKESRNDQKDPVNFRKK
jgi:hypothetical protein